MATLYQGILGGFSGKVGTIVGSIWKGIAVIRGYNPHVTNPNTVAQQEQRTKFKMIVEFLRPFVNFIRIGFQSVAVQSTTYAEALKTNLALAIKGTFPNLEIDYPKVILGKGKLAGALNPACASSVAGKVDLTWEDNTGDGGLATDTAMIAVYCPSLGKAAYELSGAARSLGTDTITVPDLWSGVQVHVYMGFKGKDGVSDCIFVDTVAVA